MRRTSHGVLALVIHALRSPDLVGGQHGSPATGAAPGPGGGQPVAGISHHQIAL